MHQLLSSSVTNESDSTPKGNFMSLLGNWRASTKLNILLERHGELAMICREVYISKCLQFILGVHEAHWYLRKEVSVFAR